MVPLAAVCVQACGAAQWGVVPLAACLLTTMTAELAAAITGVVSVLTPCLSRVRCVVRNREGRTEWGLGFTDAHLFPVETSPPAPP